MSNPRNDVLDVRDAIEAAYVTAQQEVSRLWEDSFLDALSAAGFVVLRAPEGTDLRHGDELHEGSSGGEVCGWARHNFYVDRQVAEDTRLIEVPESFAHKPDEWWAHVDRCSDCSRRWRRPVEVNHD